MTTAQPWWVRPAVVLPIVAGLAFAAALFSPVASGPRSGDPRLSTLSSAPLGARLFHDLAQRLGWRTERRLIATFDADPGSIQAVLAPLIPLRSTEAHLLLDHVRAGGAALVVASNGTAALLDSLHLVIGPGGTALGVEPDSATCTDKDRDRRISLWFGAPPQMLTLDWVAPPPGELRSFLTVERLDKDGKRLNEPSMIGFEYGAGRMVIAADPDVLRNDAMRDCLPGFDVSAMRALEFLRDGGARPRDLLVFDEFHQANGAHPGSIRAAIHFLGNSPSGRLLAQLALAGVVLLIALAPRTVPPRDETRVERRSPLEQVDALSRAYAQVKATRTAAQRLVRGLRRRVERAPTRELRALDDDAWLAQLAVKSPQLRDDVALARRSLAETLSPKVFATLGPALHQIEVTLTRT
ncbi:MAG: hypothetical protein K8S21_10665 [Gemmatimonadetes bacterium]|nr:hypothetical protein [Gemmatimonadota bacterium]